MFSVLIGRWWKTVQFVQLTRDCSTTVEQRQGMNGRPTLIVWQTGRVVDGGTRRRPPGRCSRPNRTELCHWDSSKSEHRGKTVSVLACATSEDQVSQLMDTDRWVTCLDHSEQCRVFIVPSCRSLIHINTLTSKNWSNSLTNGGVCISVMQTDTWAICLQFAYTILIDTQKRTNWSKSYCELIAQIIWITF